MKYLFCLAALAACSLSLPVCAQVSSSRALQKQSGSVPGGGAPQRQGLPGFELDGTRWTYQDQSLSMEGILLKPEGDGPFPAVLISHGLGGSAESFGLGKAREFVQWGLVCIAPNYTHQRSALGPRKGPPAKGAGRSNLGASEENIRRALKCVEILESLPLVDKTRIAAYGHSMGGFVTIGLAAAAPDRLKAAAITASGIAPLAGFPAPTGEVAAKVRTPFLMMHGSADRTVRPEQSAALKSVLDKSGVQNQRYVFDGEDHPIDQARREEVFGLMRKWFQIHLKLPGGSSLAMPPAAEVGARRTDPQDQPAGEPEWVKEPIEARNTRYKTFQSRIIGREVSYLVYLPAEYEKSKDKRFPVMYWLHGIGGAQTGLPRYIQRLDDAIEAGKTPPMIVVFVNGVRDSFYCDSADGRTPVETVIVKDLIPHIDQTYRTIADRQGRIVEGFSMGGFGAAHLGFKYPELFSAVSLLDAALLNVGTMQGRHAALYQRIFGGREETFEAENPRTLVEKNAEAIRGRTAVRFAVGALVEGNRSLDEQLTRLGIAHDYDAFEGVGHNHAGILDRLGDKNWAFYRAAIGQPAREALPQRNAEAGQYVSPIQGIGSGQRQACVDQAGAHRVAPGMTVQSSDAENHGHSGHPSPRGAYRKTSPSIGSTCSACAPARFAAIEPGSFGHCAPKARMHRRTLQLDQRFQEAVQNTALHAYEQFTSPESACRAPVNELLVGQRLESAKPSADGGVY